MHISRCIFNMCPVWLRNASAYESKMGEEHLILTLIRENRNTKTSWFPAVLDGLMLCLGVNAVEGLNSVTAVRTILRGWFCEVVGCVWGTSPLKTTSSQCPGVGTEFWRVERSVTVAHLRYFFKTQSLNGTQSGLQSQGLLVRFFYVPLSIFRVIIHYISNVFSFQALLFQKLIYYTQFITLSYSFMLYYL